MMLHKTYYKYFAAWRGATGLSATSPRSFLAVGFPLLSLAGVITQTPEPQA
ncbi:MAG: hypothetical protein ACKVOQ_10990 [Cyclobacteriaceae bacterium]